MRPKKTEALELAPRRLEDAPVHGARVGWVTSARGGAVKVDYEGNRRGALLARVAAGIGDAELERAAAEKADALLLFEAGDPARPVLVTLLRSATPLTDAILAAAPAARKVARVDGEKVELEGREEVVLRCGKATLTLRRDGRIVLKGVDVVTEARGTQKIRGGRVQIN